MALAEKRSKKEGGELSRGGGSAMGGRRERISMPGGQADGERGARRRRPTRTSAIPPGPRQTQWAGANEAALPTVGPCSVGRWAAALQLARACSPRRRFRTFLRHFLPVHLSSRSPKSGFPQNGRTEVQRSTARERDVFGVTRCFDFRPPFCCAGSTEKVGFSG